MKVFKPVLVLLLLSWMATNVLAAPAQYSDELADPTKPSSVEVGNTKKADNEQQDFKLSSILLSPRRRMAIINGKLLYIGDEIEGAHVIAIDKDSVLLQGVGGVVSLQLLPDVVTK